MNIGQFLLDSECNLLLLFQVLHYVEKPSTFVSDIINCGIYLFTPEIFQHIGAVFQKNQQDMLL
jgi:mannose-1-phosphate guanylyltransferase